MNSLLVYLLFYRFISQNILSFLSIRVIDLFIKHKKYEGRWFQLHFIINFIICIFTYQDVYDCLLYPEKSIEHLRYDLAGSFAFTLHVYHTIFFTLSPIEVYHHLLSVFFCAPMCLINPTKALSCYYFFCTGLPGGIDYVLLSLVKNKRMYSLKEKYINMYLNTYIRIPGGIIASYLLFKDSIYIKAHPEEVDYIYAANLLLAFVVFFNSTIFGKISIENYTERRIAQQVK